MNIEACVNSLSMPLPEDILKRKWAGDLEGAIRAIDMRLERWLPDMLRARLECEKERIRRLPTQYPFNRAKRSGSSSRARRTLWTASPSITAIPTIP